MIVTERVRKHEGKVYLIRDVVVGRPDGRLFVSVFYATVDNTGELKWTRTYEGALFDDMEPFEP